jgi:hypothetical protein
MGTATDYTENAIINGLLDGGNINLSSGKPFIGLFTVSPTETGGGTECSGGGYARIQIGDTGQGDFDNSTTGTASNQAEFVFPDATSNWGTISHIGLFDAVSGGNLLMFGSLNSSVLIDNGDIFKIPTNGFTISMD